MNNTNDEQRVLAALRRLPRASAGADARERARREFMAGAIAERSERDRPVRTRAGRRWAALLLAAALGSVALFVFGSQPVMTWEILDVVAPAGVAVDGRTPAVGESIPDGAIVLAPGSELELQLGERLRVRLLADTRLELPAGPGRWFGRGRTLKLEQGEIYGTSGGEPLGFDLVFETAELTARLTGTTFAVFRTADASCVCLWSGGIEVSPRAGDDLYQLEPRKRLWVYRDGRGPEIMPLSDMETMKLQMTDETGLAPAAKD